MKLKLIIGKTIETTQVVDAETGEAVEGVIAVTFNDGTVSDIYSVSISFDVSKVELSVAEAE